MRREEMTNKIKEHETCWPCEERAISLGHPEDVLNHPGLSVLDKRSILANWASDAHSVPGVPAMRMLPCGAIVKVDVILQALAALDDSDALISSKQRWDSLPRRRKARLPTWRRTPWSRRDDDDEPPPCPAAIQPYRPRPFLFVSAASRPVCLAD